MCGYGKGVSRPLDHPGRVCGHTVKVEDEPLGGTGVKGEFGKSRRNPWTSVSLSRKFSVFETCTVRETNLTKRERGLTE